MKLFSLKGFAVLSVCVAGLALYSCKKETVAPPKTVSTQKPDPSEVLGSIDDAYGTISSTISDVMSGNLTPKKENSSSLLSSCATVTQDTFSSPKTVVLDFGTGCVSSDGKMRSGKISASYTGDKMSTVGTEVFATFDHYKVDDKELNGNYHIHNIGSNTNSNIVVTLDIDATRSFQSTGETLTATAHIEYEWIAGQLTSTHSDDQVSITGHVGGTENGTNFTLDIDNSDPLLNAVKPCTDSYVQGKFTLISGANPAETYDFGTGTCDDQAYHIVGTDTTMVNAH
jgi:hypothetical protein